jgi:hypothetical protein
MVEGLVREFIPNALAADLDFRALQRVNPKFHIGRLAAARREGPRRARLAVGIQPTALTGSPSYYVGTAGTVSADTIQRISNAPSTSRKGAKACCAPPAFD